MQRLANRLIELLEAKELLPEEVVSELRRQVANSKARLQPELLARLLVDNGHLTKFQATKLISELNASRSAGPKTSSDEELGFAPSRQIPEAVLEDESESKNTEPNSGDRDRALGLAGTATAGSPDAAATAARKSNSRQPSPVPATAQPNAIKDAQSQTVTQGNAQSVMTGMEDFSTAPARAVRTGMKKANPWDSFRILGVGVILSLVLVAGFVLVRWMVRGNADDALQFADNAYQQRSYEDAVNSYRNFAVNWPTHEMASYARVRSVLSSLRKDVESTPNPVVALRTAEEMLPGIIEESALFDQQSDLAGVLVALAEKFIARMDAVKSTDDRKTLMADMNLLMNLVGDPQLVGSAQRAQLAPTLQRVEESRSRIQREIQRDDQLIIALAEIDGHLDARETFKANDVRKTLIARYPLLESHPEVIQRVLKASEIQRELVKEVSSFVETSSESVDQRPGQTFVLSNSSGNPIAALRGGLVYYRIKGSIYALDAENGRVLWRRFVGRGLDVEPVRVSDSPESDVVVAVPETGRILRLDGRSGVVQWVVELGEIVYQPIVESEDLFVATRSGHLINLDAETGYAKWTRLLPQSLEVGPAIRSGGRWLYQTAGHSNVYVIDRRNGECSQVLYLGHREGSIQVPPVIVMGHLILVENINLDSARIRVFPTDDSRLQASQAAIPIDGNVVVLPSVDGRQVLVQSNLGNSILLDVEPSAQGEKVTVVARVPRNLDSPQIFWPAFENNQVWLAEKRLARFDLIVTQGKLNRQWIQHEGDEFIGPLQLLDGTLLHARRPNGNQGVQVSAANAEEGTNLWSVDLGVPVTLLHRDGSGRYDAVTSSGGLYGFTEFTDRLTADETSPGGAIAMKRFVNPTWISDSRAILLNASNPREFALYSSDRPNRLRILTVPFGSAQPSGPVAAVGKRAVVGLSNGQLAMFEPESGVMVGTPYQGVPLRPGQKIRWSQPAVLPDETGLIVACDAGRIFRLSAGDSLRPLSEEALESPIISPIVFVQDRLAAVESSGGRDELVLIDASTLKVVQRGSLRGRWISGPFALGDGVAVQTDQEVQMWDSSGNHRWSVPVAGSALIAPPSTIADSFLWATIDGKIWIVNSNDGSIRGSVAIGQSISTAPLMEEERILIGSDEGVIIEIPIPTEDLISGAENW